MHDTIIDVYSKSYNNTGYTSFGVKYAQGASQGSGDPFTSLFNSIRNHFISFLAAWLETGKYDFDVKTMVGGDDNITFDIKREHVVNAAKMMGQDFETSEIPRGKKFTFLSRHFTGEIWYGNPASHCDIIRTLAKFNLTPNLSPDVTPAQKLIEKCMAYYKTDRNTPILGDFLQRAHEITHGFENTKHLDCAKTITPFFSMYDESVQFNNDIVDVIDVHDILPLFDYEAYINYLNTCHSIDDLLNIPCFDHTPIDVPQRTNVIINEELFSNLEPTKIETPEEFDKAINSTNATTTISSSTIATTMMPECPSPLPDKAYHFKRSIKAALEKNHTTLPCRPFILDIGAGDCKATLECCSTLRSHSPIAVVIDPKIKTSPHNAITAFYGDIASYNKDYHKQAIDILILSSSIHHMAEDELYRVFTDLKFSETAIVYIREHDWQSGLQDALDITHVKYNDPSPTYYWTRKALLDYAHTHGKWKLAGASNYPREKNVLNIFHVALMRRVKEKV